MAGLTRSLAAMSVPGVASAVSTRDALEARTTRERGLACVDLCVDACTDPSTGERAAACVHGAAGVLRPAFVEALVSHLEGLTRQGPALVWLGSRVGAHAPGGLFVGADELSGLGSRGAGEALARAGQRALARLGRLPVVVVVTGPARGGLVELAGAARGLVLERGAALGLSLAELGLLEAQGGLVGAATRAGLGAALELSRGALVHAPRALELGLADAVAPREALVEAAVSLARSLDRARGEARERAGLATLRESRLARGLTLARARRSLGARARHEPAHARALDVLGALAAKGADAAHDEAATAFGELATSSPSRELVLLARRREALGQSASPLEPPRRLERGAFEARVLGAAQGEVRHLEREGLSLRAIERALSDWGFPPSLLTGEANEARPSDARPELALELRVVLAWLLEAVRALDEGLVPSEAEADVRSVDAGFPAFRGGPLRYVEAVGAGELVRRLEWLERRHGERFAAPRRLRDRAPSASG